MNNETEELDLEAQFELLVQLIDEQFADEEFVELIRSNSLDLLAARAAAFNQGDDSNIALVLLSMAYVFTYRLQDVDGVLGHKGQFSLLREGIAQDLGNVSADEAKEVFHAMATYVRVAPEGDVLLVDDAGQRFVVVTKGHQILPWEHEDISLEPIATDNATGRELLLNAVRGVVKLEYDEGLLMGLVTEVDV